VDARRGGINLPVIVHECNSHSVDSHCFEYQFLHFIQMQLCSKNNERQKTHIFN
jgi:hypothetical protein